MPGPSTSAATTNSRPRRPIQSPSALLSALLTENTDSDDGDSLDLDGKNCGWVTDDDIIDDCDSDSDYGDDNLDSESDNDSDSDKENEDRPVEDGGQVPLLEPPVVSFVWSEGSEFEPDLHEFQRFRKVRGDERLALR